MARLAYLWDERLCVACMACVIACTANYPEWREDLDQNPYWKWLASNIKVVVKETGRPAIRFVACQHCDDAPCVRVCPTKASYIDKETGLVKFDISKCLGCRHCVVACPYGARWVGKDLMPHKCMGSLCEKRVKQGLPPLCVSVCPANARDFGDIDDPASSISMKLRVNKTEKMLEEYGTKPKFFIVKSK